MKPWKTRRQPHEATRAFQILGEVPRDTPATADGFFSRYVEPRRPVILPGLARRWPAFERWDPVYLATVAGSISGEVLISENGLFPDYVTRPEPMHTRSMAFGEFLARASGQWRGAPVAVSTETYYIYGKSYLLDASPPLRDDIVVPDLVAGKVRTPSLWASSRGCVTPLHYDLTHGLLVQLRGEKDVFLFGPDQHDRLYFRDPDFPGMNNHDRQSQVDIGDADLGAFPRFADAQAYRARLVPGDALFIPSTWAHEVETLEFSLSVGFSFAGSDAISAFATMSDELKAYPQRAGEILMRAAQMWAQDPKMLGLLSKLLPKASSKP